MRLKSRRTSRLRSEVVVTLECVGDWRALGSEGLGPPSYTGILPANRASKALWSRSFSLLSSKLILRTFVSGRHARIWATTDGLSP
jgi:hypothetical protein